MLAFETQSHVGWRALLALVCSGALAGFVVPTIASSLVRQERRQPSVRLLRAPRLPASETQITPPEAEITTGARARSVRTPRLLAPRGFEHKAQQRAPGILQIRGRPLAATPTSAAPSATVPHSSTGSPGPQGDDNPTATTGQPRPQTGGSTHDSGGTGGPSNNPADTGGTSPSATTTSG